MKLLYHVPLIRRLFYRLRPSRHDAAELWDFIVSRHSYTVVSPGNLKGEEVVRDLLATMGVLNPAAFMHHHALPIVRGKFRGVYLPYQPGENHPEFSPWVQMIDCAHTLALLSQMQEGVAKYYLDQVTRAYEEWMAFRSDHEVWWRYQGCLPEAGRSAGRLLEYGCNICEVELIEDRLEDVKSTIRTGELSTHAAQVISDWIDEKYGLYEEEKR